VVAYFHSTLARWRNHFSHLLNVHEVHDVRQPEIHTAEPLASKVSVFAIEMTSEKLKRYKSPGTEQISAETIKAGSRAIRFLIHKLSNSVRNKEE